MAWNGLDTAGVELLWDDERLLGVLEVMGRHQPFAYGDMTSPIFDDLSEFDPETVWFDPHAQSGTRSIFRRGNPLVKLGLIDGTSQSAVLTPTGLEVLQGELPLATLYQMVARGFVDADGSRSFADMARAAVLFPNHEFTLSDVEFGVSISDGTKKDLENRLSFLMHHPIQFPKTSRRPRVLRRFLKTLASANVLVATQKGWKLGSLAAAQYVLGSTTVPETQTFAQLAAMAQPVSTPAKSNFSVSEISTGPRQIPSFGAGAFANMDNSQRALLLERAHGAHESLVEDCAQDVRNAGGTPIEGSASFDVGCFDKFKLLIEAKYVSKSNAVSQFRKATAQLPEYRWRHHANSGYDAKQIIAVNENPVPFVGNDYLSYIREDRKLEVIWQSSQGLINCDGRSLQEILNHPV